MWYNKKVTKVVFSYGGSRMGMNEKRKILVEAFYSYNGGYWEIFICDEKNIPIRGRRINEPFLDFRGKIFKRKIKNVVIELERYGVTMEDVEEAILEEAQEKGINPPKFLR